MGGFPRIALALLVPALLPAEQASAQSSPRPLPDFRSIVQRFGGAVVDIRTIQTLPTDAMASLIDEREFAGSRCREPRQTHPTASHGFESRLGPSNGRTLRSAALLCPSAIGASDCSHKRLRIRSGVIGSGARMMTRRMPSLW